MQPDFSLIGPFLLAALVVFAVYRRFRRSFGRQALRPGRMTGRLVLFAVLACVLLPMALQSAQLLAAELAGAALGIALGLWGSQRTRFLMYRGQLHYVPHTYTGIAVSLLFLGRLAFRLASQFAAPTPQSRGFGASTMVKSPLTVGILFVLLGYYAWYYGWLLWKSKRLQAADIEADPAATAP